MIYKRDKVERLIPGIWDEWRVLELPDEKKPDADMPKVPQVDPRRSTDRNTELADIQQAWRNAPLTLRQRQAVLLRHALDFTEDEGGSKLCMSRQVFQRHSFKGVTRLMDWLNGTNEDEMAEDVERDD